MPGQSFNVMMRLFGPLEPWFDKSWRPVRDFCGHGIGQIFHVSPKILNFVRGGEGLELRGGMIFTGEPMINLGRGEVKMLADD